MKEYLAEYERWINDSFFDEDMKNELKSITDEKEIEDRFYKRLDFGTGGLRGVMGAGTNRMNFYTVGKASQGLAEFIKSEKAYGSVVIAYDSRNKSAEFAKDSACVFAANGVKTYLFDALRPTPELSFAVRYLGATAGVVITASHNPPQYNGYKVYWSDGAQIVPPYDKKIIDSINAVSDYAMIKRISEKEAVNKGLLVIVGKEIDDAYVSAVKGIILNPEAILRQADDIKIVYSPLNGAGKMPVLRVLKELGFKNVWTVKEQEMPDGNFPTLKYPNPEDAAAFDLALALAREKDADIVLATDPDSDRLGVYAKNEKGEYKAFSGNMSGLLIAEYRLSQMAAKGLLPKNRSDAALVTTIVSSRLSEKIAAEYGITVFNVLTGFKYIGEKIKQFEIAKAECGGKADAGKGAYEFIFGFEESYGCLVGTYARDKDAVTAVCALCEAAAFYKERGLTLCEVMDGMFAHYGYFREGLVTETYLGADGLKTMQGIMRKLRENPPCKIGENTVKAVRDYLSSERTDMVTGEKSRLNLVKSDVLYYELENDGWCCIRPSGTEPKIKLYFGVKGATEQKAEKMSENLKSAIVAVVKG